MTPKTILHVVGRLDVGGIEKYLLDFIPEAASRGVRSDIVTLFERKPGSLARQFESLGCLIYPIHALRRRKLLRPTLMHALDASGADVLHSHVGEMSGDAVRVLHGKKIKLVVQAHDLGGPSHWFLEPYRRLSRFWTLKYAHRLLAVSPLAGKKLVGNSRRKFSVVPIGLNVAGWAFDEDERRRNRAALHIPENTPLLLHVGRFHPVKNHSFMLRVAQHLKSANFDFVFAFAGSGATFETTKEAAKKLAVDERVLFLGETENVRGLVNAADLLLLPSLSEGTPRVLLEAAAIGLPFLATTRADLEGIFPAKYQLEPKDPATWAERIQRELSHERTPPKSSVNLSIKRAVDQTFQAYD